MGASKSKLGAIIKQFHASGEDVDSTLLNADSADACTWMEDSEFTREEYGLVDEGTRLKDSVCSNGVGF
jgi:hypothetical protein